MLTTNDIKNYLSNYIIQNGIVIDKSTNQEVENEDIILKVKTSILIYNEAKSSYENRTQSRVNKANFAHYIEKTMQQFGINGDVNDYSQNKTGEF